MQNAQNAPYTRLIMLGAALETRGGVAATVEGWRALELFRRWPVAYVPTHGADGVRGEARLALKALRSFATALAEHRRVAVHAHVCARAGFWRQAAFVALAGAARCPLVLQLHGGGFDALYDEASTVLKGMIRLALERAACVLVPCESLRAWVRSVTREANAVLLPPAIEPGTAAPGARQNVILFLGRLEAERGVFDLVEALAQARGAVPDLRLVCAGEGDGGAVARFAARLGVAESVTLTGMVGPSGKRALLEGAAVLALPSYREGLPIALLEAMAAGVPVLATPVGGVPEVIADCVSGFLVAPGDKAALARLLKKLLADRALAARVGAAGRETVRWRFAPERALAPLEDLYCALGLHGSGAPAAPRAPRENLRQAA